MRSRFFILNKVFNVSIPLVRILFALLFIYIGIKILTGGFNKNKGSNNVISVIMIVMIPVILGTILFPVGFGMMRNSQSIPPIFLGFIALFMLIPVCAVLAVAWKTTPSAQSITMNSKTCEIVEKRPVFGKKTELKTSEIEELVNVKSPIGMSHPLASLIPNRGLIFRTDDCSVEFAKGLTEEAKAYIEARIKQFLLENC